MNNILLITKRRFFYSLTLFLITIIGLHFIQLPIEFSSLEKILIAYNIFQWSYLASLLVIIFTTPHRKIKEQTLLQDESANFVLIFSTIASVLTLVAIAFELGSAKETHGILKSIHLFLPALTLIGAWILLPTMYAIHYAHLYYKTENELKRPLKFPDNPENPDYFDFLYFSVTIAVASQTADISINSKRGRRLVLLQSVLAFLFNTSVLALGINVAASLLN